MSSASIMETALRNDVAQCERRVHLATPRTVIGRGQLKMRGSNLALEVAQRDLDNAVQRLEQWLADKGR